MSFEIGNTVLARWLGKTKGYVQGTTWYHATITAKRSDGRYDIDYQDEVGTVELDVPEIRLVRNVPGDNEYIQQQIRARNEEQKQLLRQKPKEMTKSISSTKVKSTSKSAKNVKLRSIKGNDDQVKAYISAAIDPNFQTTSKPIMDPNCGSYVGQRFELMNDDLWNPVHVEAIEGNMLHMRWTGWFDPEWKFRLKFLKGNYYDEKGFIVEMFPEHTHIIVHKAWITLPGTKPPIHWPGKVYVRTPFLPKKKETLAWLKKETRMYVELYGETASRPKLKPYSEGFWNTIGNIHPLRCAKAWNYINDGERGFNEGYDSAIANLFKLSFRDMINDSASRDFQFVFEGAVEIAEEKQRDAEIKKQLQLAEKEAKEKAKMEMIAAKEKAQQMKLKLPCQLSHGGVPCGRTVEDCIAFRKQMKEERSANFAPLNTKKRIMPNVVNSRYRMPNPPKTVLRKVFQIGVDIETLSPKTLSNVETELAEKRIWKACSKNLMKSDDGACNFMYEPNSGDLYQAIRISNASEDVNMMKSRKRKGGPCTHLEVGRDNSVKFLSGKFARVDQVNSSSTSGGNLHGSRLSDRNRHRNHTFENFYKNSIPGVYNDEKLRMIGLSIADISSKKTLAPVAHDRTLSEVSKGSSDSEGSPSAKSSNDSITHNAALETNNCGLIDEEETDTEPIYSSCAEDKEAEEYAEYLGKIFHDSTKYETGSRDVLNEFSIGTVVDICRMETPDEDERKHLYFKFYNHEKHNPSGNKNFVSDNGIYGYCGCVEMAGYSRTGKKKRACYSWPFKLSSFEQQGTKRR